MRPARKRFRTLDTPRFRRRSWRRAGAALRTVARATSQRRLSDRATRMRTPDTDWAARVPAGGGGTGGGGGGGPGGGGGEGGGGGGGGDAPGVVKLPFMKESCGSHTN